MRIIFYLPKYQLYFIFFILDMALQHLEMLPKLNIQ